MRQFKGNPFARQPRKPRKMIGFLVSCSQYHGEFEIAWAPVYAPVQEVA